MVPCSFLLGSTKEGVGFSLRELCILECKRYVEQNPDSGNACEVVIDLLYGAALDF
jgi:hypothetical protein